MRDLEAARKRRLNWRNQIARSYQSNTLENGVATLNQIQDVLNDNLNSPQALAIIDQANNHSLEFWQKIDESLGLDLITDSPDMNDKAKDILAKRDIARTNRDYAKSDQLRDELKKFNLTVLDTPQGQIWQYLK